MTPSAHGVLMTTTLLDGPGVRQLWGGPIWQTFLTIGGHSIAGRSRHRWLARIKAIANHATYLACGRHSDSRIWWRLRWP